MKKTLLNLILRLFISLAKFLFLNLSRIVIIVLFHGLRVSIKLFEVLLSLIAKMSPFVDISLVERTEEVAFTDPKFTENEIERMALMIPGGVETIQSISEHFGVSMRQARKIKSCAEERLIVNNYSAVKQALPAR